jgi:L-amino acid N-acyltransferase YncA
MTSVQGTPMIHLMDSKPALVRDARREDCEAVAAIYNEGIAEGHSTFETQPRTVADVSEWLGAPRHPLLVVGHGDEIAAWGRIALYSPRPCYAAIGEISLYVCAAARGRGLGNSLATALRQRAQQAAFGKLLGKCLTINHAAAKLSARHGFREVGIHLDHGQIDGQWYDVLLVELLLEAPRGDARQPALASLQRDRSN